MKNIKQNASNNLIFIPITVLILSILLELSLSKIVFFYETPPSLFLIFTYLILFVFNVNLPVFVTFLICLTYDLLFGINPGFFAGSILISSLMLHNFNLNYLNNSFFNISVFFIIFFSIVNIIQILFFIILYFNFPNLEKIIFQLGLSLLFFPLIFLLLRNGMNFFNLKLH